MKKLIFGSACMLALTASFAFKSQYNIDCTYHPLIEPTECAESITQQINCATNYTGPQCTAYDPSSQTYRPAYVYNPDGYTCLVPLYNEYY